MENTNQPNTTSENNSSIKELMTILKDGEIKNSILSLKTFQGMEIGKDKETQTSVIYLYGTKDEEPQQEDMPESILRHLDINLPSYLREATKKPTPVMKLSVPYTNLNDIFIDQVQNYLKANKLAVNAVKGDSDGKFIVMFSNKNIENKFLSDFIKDVEEYKGYTSMDAKNINVARSLTNTEIKQIVDVLNMNLSLISGEVMSNSMFQNTFKDILGKYTFQFSIDSFIKKDKNTMAESAIKNFAKLQEDSQTLKVEPPFEKWTSGDVKEAPKQKKVSTLPVELEVKVIATPIEQKVNPKQESKVETKTESILRSLGITMPKHLREANDLVPINNNQIQNKSTEVPTQNNSNQGSNLPANNVPTVTSTKTKDPRFNTSGATDVNYRTKDTPAVVNKDGKNINPTKITTPIENNDQEGTTKTRKFTINDAVDVNYRDKDTNPTEVTAPIESNEAVDTTNTNEGTTSTEVTAPIESNEAGDDEQKKEEKGTPQGTNTRVLTLDYLKVLRDCFVKSAQKQNFSIRTKENSQLINGLPVVFGNGKDKYLKVSKDGISGLFTIQAALGEQNALTKVANWAYKNKNAFKSPQDTSSVVL